MADVKLLKLITGEDILGELLGFEAGGYKIKHPVRIIVMPSSNDPKKPSVGFAPYAEFSSDKEFIINQTVVVGVMTPIKQFTDQYTTMFSPIVQPTPRLIIPGQ